MEWTHYTNSAGFAFDLPVGWIVQTTAFPSCVASSPDRLWLAVIQPLPKQPGLSPTDIIARGVYPTANLFPAAQPFDVQTLDATSAQGALHYRAPDGSEGRAQLVCVDYDQVLLLCAIAAPQAVFDSAVPVLSRIVRSQNQNAARGTTSSPDASRPNPLPPPSAFVKLTDPAHGAFTIDVPAGWQVNGGLHQAGLGDWRVAIEARSPDGILILSDPAFPQTVCHMRGWFTGHNVQVGVGSFLSLKPKAEHAADHFLKVMSKSRLASFTRIARRPRPDVAEHQRNLFAAGGGKLQRLGNIDAVETTLHRNTPAPPLVASLLSTCCFPGDYGIGTGFWVTGNFLCIAPPPLATIAEAVRTRMYLSLQFTPAMNKLNQQDTMQINAMSAAQNAAQWTWFAGQQAAHQAQVAMGDTIVNNYWSQQRANESMLRGWEQNQATMDRLSQDRSDAMMDRQRLADDAAGHEYDVPAGSNYYWRNPQTGQVIGTETDQPPDYQANYTQLRKM